MTEAVPLVSLVLDLDDGSREQVQRSIASVSSQALTSWELVLHGEGAESVAAHAEDPRVRALPGSGPTRHRALEALRSARGEFTAFLAAGEELAGSAVLDTVARLVEATPDVDLVYGDEVVVDEHGTPIETVLKPAWSPERLLAQPWVGRLAFLRSSLALEVCGDEDLLEAWEWDLLLRVSGRLRRVERVPVILLRSRRAGQVTSDDGVAVVRGHLRRSGVAAEVTAGTVEGTCHAARTVPDDLSVTLVIASRGERGLAWGERRWFAVEAVRSFLRHAGRARVEVVVVHTSPIEQALLDALLALDEGVRLLPYADVFCPPDMANLGVLSSSTDAVVVMDERTEVVSDGFLAELLGPLTDEGVGLTAPRMLAANGTLVDAGLAFHQHRARPTFAGRLAADPGPDGLLTLSHECSGLGRACLAMRRATFDLAGGLSPQLTVSYNVDLSFKLRHLGLRRVWVPSATAYSLGSHHRSALVPKAERLAVRRRWTAPDLDDYLPSSGAWSAARDRVRLPGRA